MLKPSDKVAIYMQDQLNGESGKMGFGAIRYLQNEIVAVIDSSQVGQSIHKFIDTKLDIPIIGRVFSVGPFSSPGSIETINNSVFHLSDEPINQALHGPQMRRVLDMGNLEESSSILPTGQSGVQMSPHYDDQAEIYIKGTYRPQLMSRRKIEKSSTLLELLPQD